jgi:hypothetical protein
VNALTGDDDYTIAEIRAGAGLIAWATPGRAVWGHQDRDSADPDEAATAGDVVSVMGGPTSGSAILYPSSVIVNDRLQVLYNPANEGTPTGGPGGGVNYLTIRADGFVRLGSHIANCPTIGAVARDYVKWYAPRATSRWLMTGDNRVGTPKAIIGAPLSGGVVTIETSTPHNISTIGSGLNFWIESLNTTPSVSSDLSNPIIVTNITIIDSTHFSFPSTAVPGVGEITAGGTSGSGACIDDISQTDTTKTNSRPDVGTAMFLGCTGGWIEGCDIDGGPQVDYTDNYDGIRFEASIACTARNNKVLNFRNDNDTANACGIKVYDSRECLVEHNYLRYNGSGMVTKRNPTGSPVDITLNVWRRNLIEDCHHFAAFSLSDEPGGDVFYQNLGINIDHIGILITGGDLDDVWIFNCTIHFNPTSFSGSGTMGIYMPASVGQSGVRVWNTIFYGCTLRVVDVDSGTMPPATQVSLQHNVYYRPSGQFYSGSGGTLDFAGFKAAFTDQDIETGAGAASIESDDSPATFTNVAGLDFTLAGSSDALNRGVDIGDLDEDSSALDAAHAGCYALASGGVSGNPIIGLEAGL